jgi:predicted Zn-dependent protease
MPPVELPPGTARYSEENPESSDFQILKVLAALLAVIVGIIALITWIANNLVWWIPPAVEGQLGVLIRPAYEQMAADAPKQATLNRLMDRLEAQLPEKQRRQFQVLLIDDPAVNAAAVPGDLIIIYAGLLQEAQSENELMMVMGHELGHFANRDHLRGLVRSLFLQILLATVLGDTSALQAAATSGIVTISNAQFSQGQERAADAFGLDLLAATYGHVAGATDFFHRLIESEGLETVTAFLNSHPTSQDRIDRLEHLIDQRGYSIGDKSPLPTDLQE